MEGNTPDISVHMPQEHSLFLHEATSGMEPTHATWNADSGAPAAAEPTPSICASDSTAPGDTEPTSSPCPAVSGAIVDIQRLPSPCHTNSAEWDESHDSVTSSDVEFDFAIDLALYGKHARETTHADLEPTSGTCYSLDPIERTDRNVLTLLHTEDKYTSLPSEEESTLVPDVEGKLAPTQDAEHFFDALQSADHTGHSRTTVWEFSFLQAPKMLLLPIIALMFLMFIMPMITWLQEEIVQVWPEGYGQGLLKKGNDKADLSK